MNRIKNVAIIMDGNGRWASQRNRPRFYGHVRGASIVSDIVETASNLGLNSLTLYAFSTENFQRPEDEKNVLFQLLKKFLLKEFERILKNNIKFRVVGSIAHLQPSTQKIITDLEEKSSLNNGLQLNFAFAYGGRAELLDAVNKILNSGKTKISSESEFCDYLYSPELSDIDLLIRTGGDQRISNFLLWQIAYAELYFTETLWPDFTANQFTEILDKVKTRERRFGKVVSKNNLLNSIEAHDAIN